ncbi:efflux RND transporter periplasmic adaptor subunit [Roseimarinus sediminis]|uniref:efflux RND transporter periplasmic adaptor subunit n=1 Tax=Roseimarinus sediminis TaxID=1610899 RepID=UPI003D194353
MRFQYFYVAVLAFLLVQCNKQYVHDGHEEESTILTEGNEHEHDEESIQITFYSKKFEVFAEAKAFMEGQPSYILAHFTHLENFKPLTNGEVSAKLLVEGNVVSQTVTSPIRPGIYEFDIKPETPGHGQLIFTIDTSQIVAEVFVNEHQHDSVALHEHAEEEHTVSQGDVVFTKEQSWKVEFATALPYYEPFGPVIKTSGKVMPAPDDQLIIAAKTNGFASIKRQQLMTSGTEVTTMQVVMNIAGNNLAENNASVRYETAKNNFEKESKNYERIKSLANQQIVSEKELLAAKTSFQNAKILFENLNSNFNNEGQQVIAPVTGTINQVMVENGQYVEAGQPLFSILKNKRLLIRVDIQPKYASVIGSFNDAIIRNVQNNKTYTLNQLNGTVVSHGRSINTENFLLPVYLEVDAQSDLISGSFTEVYLKSKNEHPVISIPNTSILEEYDHFYVYVQKTPELFEKRAITPGSTDGIKTSIISGIESHERVVTKGAYLLKLSQSTGTLDAHSGHVH